MNQIIFRRIKRLLAVGTLKSWFEVNQRKLIIYSYICTAGNFIINKNNEILIIFSILEYLGNNHKLILKYYYDIG